MLPAESLTVQLAALPLTVSDLLVGLECDDTLEVVHQATILKNRADACEVSLLAVTAQKIAQKAASDGLHELQPLVLQLQQQLQQTLQFMGCSSGDQGKGGQQ